ncbi:MAG: LysR family transcriptional regulator [Pseudomonadota bacterium]
MDRPDPRSLEQFLTLLETRSFRLAAERLGISQSALTKGLQKLERQLGYPLFLRTTRSVEPTEAAQRLAHRATEALRGLAAFGEAARTLGGGQPVTLRVGAIALAAESVVAPALVDLARTHPQIAVDLVVGSADVYEDLARGHCDLVVGDRTNFESSPFARSMRATPLREVPLVALFRNDHPVLRPVSLERLLDYPWAIPSRYFGQNPSLTALASRVEDRRFPQYRMTSLASCLALAQDTDVVTLAPAAVAASKRWPGLQAFDLGLPLTVSLALMTLSRVSPSSAVRAFEQACARALHLPVVA